MDLGWLGERDAGRMISLEEIIGYDGVDDFAGADESDSGARFVVRGEPEPADDEGRVVLLWS